MATGQNVCKHVAWSHCYSLKFIFLETIRNSCQACCVYDWYHLAQTNEASHHRVLRLHTFSVEYKQCSGSVPVSVAAQVTQSALTDTGANGTLLSSTGSIKISPQTAADPHHAAAFLTCPAAPAGARSADSTNQFARLHFPPLPVSGLYHNSSQVMRLFHLQVHSCTSAYSRSRRQRSYCRQRKTERAPLGLVLIMHDHPWVCQLKLRLPGVSFFPPLSSMLASTREKIVAL